jgi:hypothetical protein
MFEDHESMGIVLKIPDKIVECASNNQEIKKSSVESIKNFDQNTIAQRIVDDIEIFLG